MTDISKLNQIEDLTEKFLIVQLGERNLENITREQIFSAVKMMAQNLNVTNTEELRERQI